MIVNVGGTGEKTTIGIKAVGEFDISEGIYE